MSEQANDPVPAADEPVAEGSEPVAAVAEEVAAGAAEPDAGEVTAALDRAQSLRILEAVLFAATEPLDAATIARHLPKGADIVTLIDELERQYSGRGVNLVRAAGKFAMRTAADLGHVLRIERELPRKLSRAAVETLAIIAYHQPVTRAEIEEIRGVAISKGTLDVLMETDWIKPHGHRETPGRPATWVVTDTFLSHFNLDSRDDLPGLDDLRAAGLLDARPAVSAYTEHAAPAEAEPGSTEDDGAEEEVAEASEDDAPAPRSSDEGEGGGGGAPSPDAGTARSA
ncbi:MAG: SMC-Scp complex subunit ScpB [Alphaproteobacteria bacterium]|nr:SMC-Scp complex subunit ScpB [Alphaproteobacteria bacterium]